MSPSGRSISRDSGRCRYRCWWDDRVRQEISRAGGDTAKFLARVHPIRKIPERAILSLED